MSNVIGFFGGTFSPPHLGHVHAAETFMKLVPMSKLLIIPTAIPPHKAEVDGATGDDRLAMCRLAFSHIPGVEVSDMELCRGGKSYTADTIASLTADGSRVAMLIGTDMLLTLDEWYHPEYIFANADIYCIRREADTETEARIKEKNDFYSAQYGKRVTLLTADVHEMSSSDIRASLQQGTASDRLPATVSAYISSGRLYQ